jgi:biotin carboxyl carrier protein
VEARVPCGLWAVVAIQQAVAKPRVRAMVIATAMAVGTGVHNLRTSQERRVNAMTDVIAATDGTVGAIRVEEGETVEQEETVVILVAKDKEILVKAPEDGTVRQIACEEGTAVQAGDVLVVLD